MYGADLKAHFLEAAASWICDNYGLVVRYIAHRSDAKLVIWDAAIGLWPLNSGQDAGFRVDAGALVAERRHMYPVTKEDALAVLTHATEGRLLIDGVELTLDPNGDLDYYSEMIQRDRWFFPLHLRVSSRQSRVPTTGELLRIDGALRAATPPFDGLPDVGSTLGLNSDYSGATAPAISLHVDPPVDLIFDESRLLDDNFTATLHTIPTLDRSKIGLAVRPAPTPVASARQQVASQIIWSSLPDGRCAGTVTMILPKANSALAVLTLGETTVRRQWFVDPHRAESQRYISINHSDSDLKQLRHALLEGTDPYKFEQAVACLLFMLGFSPALPLESNAPDIVASTPVGAQIVVECTLRIADFASKVGKLVDRRASLQKTLTAASLPFSVTAVLVCRLPRDQIAALAEDLVSHKVILITQDDLASGLDRARFPADPDEMLRSGLDEIERASRRLE